MANANDELAEILTPEQSDQGLRSFFQSIYEVFSKTQFSVPDPLRQTVEGFLFLVGIIPHDEATECQSLRQNLAQEHGHLVRSTRQGGGICNGNGSADWNPRKIIEARQHRFKYFTSDVFEININPTRTGGCHLPGKIGIPVIETSIESQFVCDKLRIFLRIRQYPLHAPL